MPIGPTIDDVRDGRQGLDVVDRRGHSEHAGGGRKGWFDAGIAALTLDGIHHRGLFSTDVRSRPFMDVHIQTLAASHGVLAENAFFVRFLESHLHDL